jgi:hypothetical protein
MLLALPPHSVSAPSRVSKSSCSREKTCSCAVDAWPKRYYYGRGLGCHCHLCCVWQMVAFWKRNDKVERDSRRKAEKAAHELRKQEDERREAKRQQRKFNFLITQTELYAHFLQSGNHTGVCRVCSCPTTSLHW